MNVVLHLCCAPCLMAVLEPLRGEGHRVRGFFMNPNIQPFIEFRRRLKAVKVLNESLRLELDCDESYDVEATLAHLVGQGAGRCAACYRLRLGAAARHARALGFQAITTTLLASEHQDHDLVRRVGEDVARSEGLTFLARDWRSLAPAAHEAARRRNLYRQQYCGCLHSEHERYKNTGLHLYRTDRRSV